MMKALCVGIVLGAFLVAVHPANAATIIFEFTATVVSVESSFLGVKPGDSVIGRYVFESTTPATPSSPPDPTVGVYQSVGTFEVTFGLLTLSLPLSVIEVLNRPDLDRYTVAALSGTGNGALQLQLVLATTQNLGAFTNVNLPLVPPPLDLFENKQFILYVEEGASGFVQQITSAPIQMLQEIPLVCDEDRDVDRKRSRRDRDRAHVEPSEHDCDVVERKDRGRTR